MWLNIIVGTSESFPMNSVWWKTNENWVRAIESTFGHFGLRKKVNISMNRWHFVNFDSFIKIFTPNERSNMVAFNIISNSTVVNISSNDIQLKFYFPEILIFPVSCTFDEGTELSWFNYAPKWVLSNGTRLVVIG